MGFTDIVYPFTAGLNAIGGLGSDIYNIINNERNYKLSKENFDWQKQQWAETKQREDTAVTRRVEDMKKAGLNPILAVGQPAQASSPPQMQLPQKGKFNKQTDFQDIANKMMGLMTEKANIAQTLASTKLTELQQEKVKKDIDKTVVDTAKAASDMTSIDLENRQADFDYKQDQEFANKERTMGIIDKAITGTLSVLGIPIDVWHRKQMQKNRRLNNFKLLRR